MASYYDIDDILTDQESIPVELKTDIIKLGHFDPNTDSPDLKEACKLDLPLWLVSTMSKRGLLTVLEPKVFTKPYRETLKADSVHVNLRDWNEYFFEFGMKFAILSQNVDVADMLLDCFTDRYRRVMDMSQNAVNEDTSDLTKSLDALEKRLFDAGHLADKEYTKWKLRRVERITTALSLEAANRKRKRP
eukprot:m.101994 g.101994  ORF g.101994 m.101994 type:complete len:190 (-) comp27372_c0_seq1:98-667(-)